MDTATTFANTKHNTKQAQAAAGRPQTWRKGQSGNPKGRPKDGESWSAIIKQVGEMTREDILEFCPADNPIGVEIAKLPGNVQIKWLVVLRVIQSQLFDPNGVLFRELLDRLEGRVPFRAEVDGKLTVEHLHAMIDQVYGAAIDAEEVKELDDGE